MSNDFGSCVVCQNGRFKTIEEFTETVIRLAAIYNPTFARPEFRDKLQLRLEQLFTPAGKPGRPRDERVTLAVNLKLQGLPWSKILSTVIPNYADLEPSERSLERINLQHAVHARLHTKNN